MSVGAAVVANASGGPKIVQREEPSKILPQVIKTGVVCIVNDAV